MEIGIDTWWYLMTMELTLSLMDTHMYERSKPPIET
jgi:hypothetical protein